jgi:hypothetical protein
MGNILTANPPEKQAIALTISRKKEHSQAKFYYLYCIFDLPICK